MVDNKPLLQDRPPAYNAVPAAAAHDYGPQPQQGYGAIPAAAPPPYGFHDGPGKYSDTPTALKTHRRKSLTSGWSTGKKSIRLSIEQSIWR